MAPDESTSSITHSQSSSNFRRSTPPPSRKRSRSRSPTIQTTYRRPSPPSAYRRRSPPKPRRSPSPIRRSPPRENQVRPGGAQGRGRNVLAEQARLAAERETQQEAALKRQRLGVQDISNQFYNQRPEWVKERGREWRRNESQIKGLRSYNNWIKSCMIQKFSPEEKAEPEELGWGEVAKEPEEQRPLLVLDIGCGKGGDLGKWQLAPQQIGLYVGLDPAETSIKQADERFHEMTRKSRNSRRPMFDSRMLVKDCFGEWIGDIPIVQEIGINSFAGQPGSQLPRGRGFDVVTMMFSMHYAFESEERVRMMLRNVAGSLKKGGRFIGVVPNSDAITAKIRAWYADQSKQQSKPTAQTNGSTPSKPSRLPPGVTLPAPTPVAPPSPPPTSSGTPLDSAPSFANKIYSIRFPHPSVAPHTFPTALAEGTQFNTFRPAFGWKYTYWMAEAVDVPEFVVPWEAFRAVAEGFGLEQRYRKPFLEIWDEEKDDPELGPLAVRMGVTGRNGREGELGMSEEEKEAVGLYHGFCFVKV